MPGTHSIFAPSSMGDKMKCLGRHLATLGIDNETSSSYAERGTEVHDFCEQNLESYLRHGVTAKADFPEEWQWQCAMDMLAHVKEIYTQMSADGPVDFFLEEKVSLAEYDGGEFDLSQVEGTADVILWCAASKTMAIIDYKSGAGVSVNPVNNTQQSIYALGAVKMIGETPKKIFVCISQPRLEPSLQIWETDFVTLNTWLYQELLPALVAMSKPGAPFTPGESQCRWCPISGKCKAQRDEMLRVFDTPTPVEGGESPTFSDDEIDRLLLRLPEFKQWVNKIESVAMETLEEGKDLPNFKLVRGRSQRRWVDTEAADTYLRSQKLKEKERYTFKLLSPAQAEKALKDKLKNGRIRTNFDKLWEKPEGKLSYALKTDPREAVVINPTADFSSLEDLI